MLASGARLATPPASDAVKPLQQRLERKDGADSGGGREVPVLNLRALHASATSWTRGAYLSTEAQVMANVLFKTAPCMIKCAVARRRSP